MLVKKHVDMMSNWEKGYVEHVVLPKAKVKAISVHCKERMEERGINYTLADFNKDLQMANLVEFNNNDGKMAMLFRSQKVLKGTKKGKANLVFVLGYNYTVVSCWLNNVNDKHDTLDMAQYSKVSVKKLNTGWAK